MAQIKITIEPDGAVTMEVLGGDGRSCTDLTKPFSEALGKTVSDRKLPEYYQEGRAARRVKGGAR